MCASVGVQCTYPGSRAPYPSEVTGGALGQVSHLTPSAPFQEITVCFRPRSLADDLSPSVRTNRTTHTRPKRVTRAHDGYYPNGPSQERYSGLCTPMYPGQPGILPL